MKKPRSERPKARADLQCAALAEKIDELLDKSWRIQPVYDVHSDGKAQGYREAIEFLRPLLRAMILEEE